MRDLGFLIWIVLLFVGVGGSIVSSIRKQAQRNPPPMAARRMQPGAPQGSQPLAAPSRERPMPAPQRTVRPRPEPSKTSSEPPPFFVDHPQRRPQRLFPNKSDVVRAVIAAEVLGKPRGLADEYPFR